MSGEELVSASEVAAWIEGHRFEDLTGRPNLRRFDASLAAAFGERDFSDEAVEALFAEYPKVMAKKEWL